MSGAPRLGSREHSLENMVLLIPPLLFLNVTELIFLMMCSDHLFSNYFQVDL